MRRRFGLGLGWREQPNAPLIIEVYVDGSQAEMFVAGQFREELQERGMGDGRHGFQWKVPNWVKDGNPHTLELRSRSGRVLRGTPAIINCEPASP